MKFQDYKYERPVVEEIKKDAETMAKFLRKKDVPPLAGGDPQKIDDKKTAMKGMLASLKGE